MIRKIKELRDLPLVEGKTYKTKFATGWEFTITTIERSKSGRITRIMGIYSNSPELGPCPLNEDRIIPEKEFTGKEIEICGHCETPLYCD